MYRLEPTRLDCFSKKIKSYVCTSEKLGLDTAILLERKQAKFLDYLFFRRF